MSENTELRSTESQLDRIELQLSRVQTQIGQIREMLIFLVIVSPPGLYCMAILVSSSGTLGASGFWIAMAMAAGFLLLLLIARLNGTHRTLRLNKDDLTRILKKFDHGDSSTPA
jgi:hypothetical protein